MQVYPPFLEGGLGDPKKHPAVQGSSGSRGWQLREGQPGPLVWDPSADVCVRPLCCRLWAQNGLVGTGCSAQGHIWDQSSSAPRSLALNTSDPANTLERIKDADSQGALLRAEGPPPWTRMVADGAGLQPLTRRIIGQRK